MTRKFSLTFEVPDGMTVEDLARTINIVAEHFTVGLNAEQREQRLAPNTRGLVWTDGGEVLGRFTLGAPLVAREITEPTPERVDADPISTAYAGSATRQQVAPTLGPADELALVWAKSSAAALMFFGAPPDASCVVVKERPETDEEKRRYHHNAKLYGVAYKKRTREFIQSTAGVRKPMTFIVQDEACAHCGDDVHDGPCKQNFCVECGVECASACSQHPRAGVRTEITMRRGV